MPEPVHRSQQYLRVVPASVRQTPLVPQSALVAHSRVQYPPGKPLTGRLQDSPVAQLPVVHDEPKEPYGGVCVTDMHDRLTHRKPAAQTCEHEPQWLESVLRLKQVPPQLVVFTPQHTPWSQDSSDAHACPHAPQLRLS